MAHSINNNTNIKALHVQKKKKKKDDFYNRTKISGYI